MKIPRNFEITYREGVYIKNSIIHDTRLNLLLSVNEFDKNKIAIIKDVEKNVIKNKLYKLKREKKILAIEEWKTDFSLLNEFNIFYIKSPNIILNLFLNKIIFFNKNKLTMLCQFVLFMTSLSLPILIIALLIYNKSTFLSYTLLLMSIYVTALFIHEVSHCIFYWLLNNEKSNGYFVIEKNSMKFVSKTISIKKDRVVAISGSLGGSIYVLVLISLFELPTVFWIIFLYQIMQVLPIFPDGKIIFGGDDIES